ncbi:TPA: hypothetical protein ACS7ZV_003561 [Providencia alcalifaciens]
MKNLINSVFFEKKEAILSIVLFGCLRLFLLTFSFVFIVFCVPYTMGIIFYDEISIIETFKSGFWLCLFSLAFTMLITLLGVKIYYLGKNGILGK